MTRGLSGGQIALRYTGFAVLATLANLGAQRVVLAFGDSAALFALAVLVGTGVGLVVKYTLDKRWVFLDATRGLAAQGRQFGLYSAMGLITTAIFWATETAFWMIWETHLAREVGAVLGLAVGYWVKYRLDSRFVFSARPA